MDSHNMAGLPYIGCKISLISNADIRYEGILYTIDTYQSTVALQHVRTFGTEGRRQPEIPPGTKTYEFIVFKGKDIKDLTVCEQAPSRALDDPAIVAVNAPPASLTTPQSANYPSMNDSRGGYAGGRAYGGMQGGNQRFMNGGGGGMWGYGGGRPEPSYPQRGPNGSLVSPQGRGDENREAPMGRGGYRFSRGGGRGGAGGPRRVVGELPPQPNQAIKKEMSQAFDFDESNAKFDKSEAVKESTAEPTKEEGESSTVAPTTKSTSVKTGYDKKTSFFDHISCETLDRQAGQDSRVDRDKQRKLDCETFGPSAALPRAPRFRRNFRRGGGGRRGGMNSGGGNGPQQRYVPVNSYMNYGGGYGAGGSMGHRY